jgi:hypothetical protein
MTGKVKSMLCLVCGRRESRGVVKDGVGVGVKAGSNERVNCFVL